MEQLIKGREPAQLVVKLVSDGIPTVDADGIPVHLRERYTEHRYVHSVVEPDPDLGDLLPQVAHIYECSVTGTRKKWGVEALSELS